MNEKKTTIEFVLESSLAKLPSRGSPDSAGLDLTACEYVIIEPLSWKVVSTGLRTAVPTDSYARIAARSGLAANHGISVNAGVVDADYRGVIKVVLHNHSRDSSFEVKPGDRIAQLIVEKVYMLEPVAVESFFIAGYEETTARGANGFGSTGISDEKVRI